MFALESLSLVDETYGNSTHAKRACEFLLSKQKPDGGWGESYQVSRYFSLFCGRTCRYIPLDLMAITCTVFY
jgi:hypothetical protein